MLSHLYRSLSVFLLAAWLFGSSQAEAADIRVEKESPDGIVVISVEGEFVRGDEKKFAQAALPNPMAVVIFNSLGGSTVAGIEIGRAIRLKGFLTYVPGGAVCASACSYAWLGGVQRFMERTSMIGFHASYVRENGVNKESGVANAMVGAYLNSLGLSQYAVAYISTAPPEDMTWITSEEAERVGIGLQVIDDKGDPEKPAAINVPAGDEDEVTVAPLSPPSGSSVQTVSPSASPAPVVKPARVMSFMAGVDIFGHDLPGMPLKNITVRQCEEACVADIRCKAFTFNMRHNVCFLKSHGERVFRNPNAQAGYMKDLQSTLRQSRITIMERTDLPGNDYEELSDVGFGQCSDRCESDSRCEAFTYMAKRKRCWLKDSLSGPAPSKLTISGVKEQ